MSANPAMRARSAGEAAIQASALSIIRGLSEVLAQPRDVTQILGDMLVHGLDAAGLSTGLIYVTEPGGAHRLQAQSGIPAERTPDAEALFGHPGLIRRVVESGEPAALSSGDGADAEASDFLHRVGATSALVLPFVVLGEVFGVLVLASDGHDLCEPSWTGFARSLAVQFGQAVALGQSLKRLAASESKYRALVEQADDAIYLLDPAGVVLEANRMAETLLGLPRDQLIGRPISAFALGMGGPAQEHVGRFERALAAGGRRLDDVSLRKGDGSAVDAEFSLSRNEIDGRPMVMAIGRDVTERNQAVRALRNAQQRLDHVLSQSPTVLFSLKPVGDALQLEWISENVERLLGYAADECLAAEWWTSHLHEDDRGRVLDDLAGIATGEVVQHEYRFRGRDGGYLWLRAETRLLRDSAGSPVEAIGSWSDVTALKRAERKLHDSEWQYRLLFDSNPHPMYVFADDTLAFLAVNDAAVHHYGYSRPEFLRMTLADIRRPEELPAVHQALAKGRAAGDPVQVVGAFEHRKKDGATLLMDIAANLIEFEGRTAWLVLAMDVTETRALEAQIVRGQKMEAVGQLAGGIAHDFNNLLGVITGYCELLLREMPADSRGRKRAEQIQRAADRAAALTRQLLAFGRRQVLQPKVLDLNHVVADVDKMMRRLISESIQIVIIPAARLGRVLADAGQVEQVLLNLAINARDAMPSGGRLVIETRNAELDESYVRAHPEARPGPYVMLMVSDSGHGMDRRTLSRIFEPFFTTKEEGKGTGLGLATVYGIVRQSGGTVNVYSEPGLGTTFKVYLPRVEADVAVDAPPADTAPARGTETILLVEDAEALRLLIRELLESAGYSVIDADAPDKALRLAEETAGPIDLVLTDMVMPRMSGQDFARRVVGVHPEARVVFMSGYSDQAVGGEGILEPGTLFLQKPFTMDALMRMIRSALASPAHGA